MYHSQDLFLFHLTQSSSRASKPIPGAFFKPTSGNCLTLQLPEVARPVRANKKLTKSLKRKNWGMRCPQQGLKTDISWKPRSHTHVRGSAHGKKRPEKIVFSSLWATLRYFTIRKQRPRQYYKLLEMWKTFHNTHSPLTKAGRHIGSKAFTKICHSSS